MYLPQVIVAVLILLPGMLFATAQNEDSADVSATEELQEVEISWWNIPWRIRTPDFPADEAPDGSEFIEWASNEFMKLHPNVSVTGVLVSNAEYEQKQMAAIAAGTPPNLAPAKQKVSLARAGLIIPVGDYMSNADKNDFIPVTLERASVDGKIYGFPWAFGNNGMGVTNLIYPQMFEEAGVDWENIVENGWTMDEFLEVGKKISRDTDSDGVNDIFLTGFQGKKPFTDLPYVLNFGGSFINEDDSAFTVESEEFLEGLQFIVDAIYEHEIAPKGAEALDNYGVIKPFHAHNLAMGNGGPYEIGRIDRYVKRGDIEAFRPHVTPYPGVSGVDRKTYLATFEFNVYKEAENDATREAAVELGKFLTSSEMLVSLETVLYISSRKSSNEKMYQSDDWVEFTPDIARYAKELSDYGTSFYGSQNFDPIWTKVKPFWVAAIEAVYSRSKTPEQAMQDFLKDANPIAGF